ncbi:MAG: porin [Nitrosomonadales bacterium]|nr:porin [Nitrosomonadales bacterium]
MNFKETFKVNIKKSIKGLIALALAGSFSATTFAAPSNAEIFDMMQEMKQELKALKAENDALKGTVEDVAVSTDEAIKAQIKLANKKHWGGYGELHYNNYEGDGPGVADKDAIDFHRFVLFFGYEFRDDLRFFSEFELEHSLAGEGKPGEVELEQAYIQYDINETTQITSGLFLMPVGILNETHEPDTFYGVERNTVEKNIIPSTWWEAGVMVTKEVRPGLTMDVAIHSGLEATDASSYKPRDGRQKVASADASSLAGTARIKYTAVPGLTLAGSLFMQTDYCQGQQVGCGSANLVETHAIYQKDKFNLRALYARWDIDGTDVETDGADKQNGWYVEPSWRFNDKWGAFARYETYDNNDGGSTDTEVDQRSIGFNYWIDPTVVAKFDYVDQEKTNDGGQDGINIGLGYSF